MIRKYLIYTLTVVVVIIIAAILVLKTSGTDENLLTTTAQKGPFEVLVYSSGQLESKESDNIYIPEELKDNRARIGNLTITDLVEEGTFVDSGGYVATLDHQAVEEQLKTAQDEYEKLASEYEDSKIDSNLTLSNQRDLIVNSQLDLEEKKIIIDESQFEAPSVRKKAEMDYDKAKRMLEQVTTAYGLKEQQEINKVARKFINFKQIKERVEVLKKLYGALIITSPKSGFISYFKHPFGDVTQTGSRVSQWNQIVATFPNMENLISLTYINEIDISKIAVGQKVTIGIDAFPEKTLYGEVTNLANVGQLMPKSDAKVFEVKIKVNGTDYNLKPSMTTSNIIQAKFIDECIFIPIESVFKNDSLSFVYIKDKKIRKQIVELGDENENFIVVKQGIAENDILCLMPPENAESLQTEGMEIYEDILIKEKEKLGREEEERQKRNSEKKEPILPPGLNPSAMSEIQSSN